jgi:hypothetical protein
MKLIKCHVLLIGVIAFLKHGGGVESKVFWK